jgi:cell division septation protein DedD
VETPIKHRLTGAIILVALIVVLVPEMLSGPRAPDAAAPVAPLALPPVGAVTGTAAPLRSIDIDVADRPSGATAPVAAPNGGDATDLATAPAANAPAANAPAANAPEVPVAQGAAGGSSYVVQVGSFAARTTADTLAATLRRQGFAASVSAVQSGGRTLHRVRVGPAGSRDAADALRLRLRTAGHTGSVVPEP